MDKLISAAEACRFSKFLTFLRSRGRKNKTGETYSSAHRVLCEYFSNRDHTASDWENVTGFDLREWKAEALKRGLAPTTINHRLQFAKVYVTWLVRQGDIRTEQAETIRAVPEIQLQRLGVKTLEPDLFRRLMRNVELTATKRDKAIIYLLLSGLRVSEVVSLRHNDITLTTNRGSVRIQGEHVKASSSRVVPLNRQARINLQAYLTEVTGDILFVGERGALTTDGIYKIVRKYGDAVGIDIHPHALRHEFAMQFMATNPDGLVDLQALLGHSNLETTAKHYVRRRFSDLESGVERMII